MKTAKEVHEWIGETVGCNFKNQDKLIEEFLSNWEKEIRKDQVNKCVKSLDNCDPFVIFLERRVVFFSRIFLYAFMSFMFFSKSTKIFL